MAGNTKPSAIPSWGKAAMMIVIIVVICENVTIIKVKVVHLKKKKKKRSSPGCQKHRWQWRCSSDLVGTTWLPAGNHMLYIMFNIKYITIFIWKEPRGRNTLS